MAILSRIKTIRIVTDDGDLFPSNEAYPKVRTLKDGVWYDEDNQPTKDELNILEETNQRLTG